jgi:drug/metabolite transporter (DMT)-like permease
MSSRSGLQRTALLMCVLSLIWSYNWILVKEGLRFSGPFDFSALRCIFGATLMFGVLKYLKKPLAPPALGRAFLLGLFQTTGFLCFSSWALVEGAVGKSAVLIYTFPFWTLLFAWLALGERIRGLQWIGVVVAAAGLILVLEPWAFTGNLFSRVLAVLSGVSWAISTIIAKKWRSRGDFDLLTVTTWQLFLGGLVCCAIALAVPSKPVEWNGYFVLTIVGSGGIATAGGWMLWLHILKRLSAGVAGLGMMAVPALGVLFSRLHYGETFDRIEIAGMLLLGTSLVLLSWINMRGQSVVTPPMAQEGMTP